MNLESVSFLYNNNEQTEQEIREAIQFTITSKTAKYLAINLMKENKDHFNENYQPLRKKLKKTSEDEKLSHACGLLELTL
jgi:hypothetical protein